MTRSRRSTKYPSRPTNPSTSVRYPDAPRRASGDRAPCASAPTYHSSRTTSSGRTMSCPAFPSILTIRECPSHPTIRECPSHPTNQGCPSHPTNQGCPSHPTRCRLWHRWPMCRQPRHRCPPIAPAQPRRPRRAARRREGYASSFGSLLDLSGMAGRGNSAPAIVQIGSDIGNRSRRWRFRIGADYYASALKDLPR